MAAALVPSHTASSNKNLATYVTFPTDESLKHHPWKAAAHFRSKPLRLLASEPLLVGIATGLCMVGRKQTTCMRRPYTSSRFHTSMRVTLPDADVNITVEDSGVPAHQTVFTVRNLAAAAFLNHGCILSAMNVIGAFEGYSDHLQMSLVLASLNVFTSLWQLASGDLDTSRPGMAGEKRIVEVSVLWLLAIVWLCARLMFSRYFPNEMDLAGCCFCITSFLMMCLGPWITALMEDLSEAEKKQIHALKICGALGLVYCFDAITLSAKGAAWWERVCEVWPEQAACEQTTLLFGALALEACLFIQRLGSAGIVPDPKTRENWGIASSVGLTVLPVCGQLFWKSEGLSLHEFYLI